MSTATLPPPVPTQPPTLPPTSTTSVPIPVRRPDSASRVSPDTTGKHQHLVVYEYDCAWLRLTLAFVYALWPTAEIPFGETEVTRWQMTRVMQRVRKLCRRSRWLIVMVSLLFCESSFCSPATLQYTDHELIPAMNASVVAMQGSASGSNVRYYSTWKHSPLKEMNKAITMLIIKITLQWLHWFRFTFHRERWIIRTFVVTVVILNVNDKFVAHSPTSKLPDVCS
jgi:hypothetical protein